MLDHFRARDQIKRCVGIGQWVDVEVNHIDPDPRDAHEFGRVIAGSWFKIKFAPEETNQIAVASTDVEIFAMNLGRDLADLSEYGSKNFIGAQSHRIAGK